MYETASGKEKLLDGGAIQLEFGGNYNPYDPTRMSTKWKEYLEDVENINGVRKYIKLLQ